MGFPILLLPTNASLPKYMLEDNLVQNNYSLFIRLYS